MKYLLMLLLLINLGFTQDNDQYIESLKEKANLGDAKAQSDLGHAYISGVYVEKDYAEAKKWYELSAQQNLDFAQHNLGAMYLEGHGVPVDYVKAREWYELAANQGFRKSQLALGFFYLNGLGVDVDINESKKYFAKSCNQKLEDACKMFQIIAYQLTDNESKAINTLISSQLDFEFHNTGNSNLNYLGNYLYFDEYDLFNLFSNNPLFAKKILNKTNNLSVFRPSFLISLKIDSMSLNDQGMIIRSTQRSKKDPYLTNVIEYAIPNFYIELAPKSYESISTGDNILLACDRVGRFASEFNYLLLNNCKNDESSLTVKSYTLSEVITHLAKINNDHIKNNKQIVLDDDTPLSAIIVLSNVLYASMLSNNFENIDVNNPDELNKYMNLLYFIGDESFDKYKNFYEEIGLSLLNTYFTQE